MDKILYFLSFLLILSALLSFFKPKNTGIKKKFFHKCPCFKAVENGLMSRICIYAGSFGFMYSVLYIGFGVYDKRLFIILFVSFAIWYFAWVLKKE
ncbi:hypothetical protein FPD46_08770 [Campylobacter peloridis]|uniref:Small hydrophobic protein n=1 Tax=Campylobacter peloridis TaxID=488546 RepID=A0A5C7DLQ3_9BACT|nr:hypothetical protein [Campylobacter peloridis]TXE78158.1 hypothetical protein FPD46_08770 [Campylobacter peloridis]